MQKCRGVPGCGGFRASRMCPHWGMMSCAICRTPREGRSLSAQCNPLCPSLCCLVRPHSPLERPSWPFSCLGFSSAVLMPCGPMCFGGSPSVRCAPNRLVGWLQMNVFGKADAMVYAGYISVRKTLCVPGSLLGPPPKLL